MIIDDVIIANFRSWEETGSYDDVVKYPQKMLMHALIEGDRETGSARWGAYDPYFGNLKLRGMFLFAAAWLTNKYPQGVDTKNATGQVQMSLQSKSVGDESIAFRTPSMMGVGDDWLTYSGYGKEFYRLRKRVGMGALVMGTGVAAMSRLNNI